MTYAEIRCELFRLRDEAQRRPMLVGELRRAAALVGKVQAMGLAPRRVGLSLRQLGLNPRAVTGARR